MAFTSHALATECAAGIRDAGAITTQVIGVKAICREAIERGIMSLYLEWTDSYGMRVG